MSLEDCISIWVSCVGDEDTGLFCHQAPIFILTNLSLGPTNQHSLSEFKTRSTLALKTVTTKCRGGLEWENQWRQRPRQTGSLYATPPSPQEAYQPYSPQLRPCSSCSWPHVGPASRVTQLSPDPEALWLHPFLPPTANYKDQAHVPSEYSRP